MVSLAPEAPPAAPLDEIPKHPFDEQRLSDEEMMFRATEAALAGLEQNVWRYILNHKEWDGVGNKAIGDIIEDGNFWDDQKTTFLSTAGAGCEGGRAPIPDIDDYEKTLKKAAYEWSTDPVAQEEKWREKALLFSQGKIPIDQVPKKALALLKGIDEGEVFPELYRGVNILNSKMNAVLKQYSVGETFELGISSFSQKLAVANQFQVTYGKDIGVVFHLRNGKGLNIKPWVERSYRYQEEVLTTGHFRVVSSRVVTERTPHYSGRGFVTTKSVHVEIEPTV